MNVSLQHYHLFASNIDKSIHFYQEMFEAEIISDAKVAGVRNVMIFWIMLEMVCRLKLMKMGQ